MSTPTPKSGEKDDVVRIMCPKLGCQRILAVPAAARGKLVRCRTCGSNIRVPMHRDERANEHPGESGKAAA
jgi:RNase P subunit RPR2